MYRRSRHRKLGAPIAIGLVVVAVGGLAWRLGWLPSLGPDDSDTTASITPPAETSASDQGTQPRTRAGRPRERTLEREAPVPPTLDMATTGDRYVHTPDPDPAPTGGSDDTTTQVPAVPTARHDLGPAPDLIESGFALIRTEPVQARELLSRGLATLDLSPDVADQVRTRLGEINEYLVFGPDAHPDDSFTQSYTIKSGDRLSTIVRRQGMLIDWRFAQRINRISKPSRIREGDPIKLVTGPFHAVIDKSDYRLDLYIGEEDHRIFVRSFDVGLGEHDGTPTGRFQINKSKMANPDWRDSRTGQYYAPDDPTNPIGEFWLGLDGIEERTAGLESYGMHGTIEPDSIGRQQSRGCIRLRDDDIELLFELMVPGVSEVTIQR